MGKSCLVRNTISFSNTPIFFVRWKTRRLPRQARDRREEHFAIEAFLSAAINGSQAHPGTMTGPAANLTNGALQTSGLPEFDLANLEFFGAFISLFHGIGLRFGFGARVYTHV